MSQGAIDKAKMFLAKYKTAPAAKAKKRGDSSDSSDSDRPVKRAAARSKRIGSAPAGDDKTRDLLAKARALGGVRASSAASRRAPAKVAKDSISDVDISDMDFSDEDIQFSDDSPQPGSKL